MRIERKEGRKKISLKLKLFYLLLISILVVNFSIARYRTTYNASATGNLASWTFNVNNNSSQNFTINLANTTQIDTKYDRTKNVIAPGAKGSFLININCTGCNVSIEYTITLSTNELSDMPPEIVFYTLKEDETRNILISSDLGQTKTLTGSMPLSEIAINPVKELQIYWLWQINPDITESQYEGQSFYIDATVVGKQIIDE